MTKFHTVYGVKIYPMDYLMKEELTELDLNNLFDTNSFIYSVIIGMFNDAGIKKRNSDIVKELKKDNKWIDKHKWTKDQFMNFENKLAKVIKNVYVYDEKTALMKAQWFMIKYGLSTY